MITAILIAALAACSANDDDRAVFTNTDEAPALAPTDDWEIGSSDGRAGDDSISAPEAEDAPSIDVGGLGDPDGIGFDPGSIGRQVILELRVTMTSEDLRVTVDGITRSASRRGGGVAASDIRYGSVRPDGSSRSEAYALVVVKIPPDALESFLGGLDQLGEVTSIAQDAQDVTDQLTDLEVRIANAERSVERVRALLTEAENLREVIELEAELTRRQTDLERLLASQRNLAERVALSTVTIEIFPIGEAPEPEETEDGLADAFRRGLEAFGSVLFGVAVAFAVSAPFLGAAAVLAAAVWIIAFARRRNPSNRHEDQTVTNARTPDRHPPGEEDEIANPER